MKAIVTWVLIANSKKAHIVANYGPSKGFEPLGNKSWNASEPTEYSDRRGRERVPGGPLITLQSGDPAKAAELDFAHKIISELNQVKGAFEFDRLVVVAAPHMLGSLRSAMDAQVQSKVTTEVPKDLTHVGVEKLPTYLGKYIAC